MAWGSAQWSRAAHVAARYDAADALAVLIEELGASSDLRSRSGDGPVHVAARYGSERALKFLAGRPSHANDNAANNNGALPLHCAAAREAEHRRRDLAADRGAELERLGEARVDVVLAAEHEVGAVGQDLALARQVPGEAVGVAQELGRARSVG